jgi:kynureninase
MGAITLYEPSLAFAEDMDRKDPLREFREAFLFPRHEDRDCLYFCGNSLGLQPRRVTSYLQEELARWAMLGVEGHFKGELPWLRFHRALAPASAHIVGALESEVIVMNTLTVNLHLMMVSFYRPRDGRFKVMMEAGAFPSDQYAVESQLRWHGLDPEEALVEIAPRPGEECLRDEDILSAIEEHGNSLALVLFGGLNYYTGQLYDMAAITQAAHRAGAIAGFDLAHAAGNVPLRLHDWGVDFAVWCTYKYMNSGPGALSGVFIHERHAFDTEVPRLAGWWGYDEKRRFKMEKGFVPNPGAEGWQLSNAPILAFAPMRASHELFLQAGMDAIRQKSILLTGYLEFLIDDLNETGSQLQLITPRNPAQRGAQLSLLTGPEGKQLFEHLARQGVICDWREHNLPTQDAAGSKAGVIRLAPAPLYNSFSDVFQLSRIIKNFTLPSL